MNEDRELIEAWDNYFEEQNLVDGTHTGNFVDDMNLAFRAGWAAAKQDNKVSKIS